MENNTQFEYNYAEEALSDYSERAFLLAENNAQYNQLKEELNKESGRDVKLGAIISIPSSINYLRKNGINIGKSGANNSSGLSAAKSKPLLSSLSGIERNLLPF